MASRITPIEYISNPLRKLLNNEAVIGILLFISAAAAIVVANSSWGGEWYHHIWEKKITFQYDDEALSLNLHHFINDGLMAIFFFLVGLEIKREFLVGELNHWRKASLPIGAAIGGMILPAAIYLAFTWNTDASHGWGIPMATDIAFTLGLINLVSRRISASSIVFVTSLAVVDDIGAVLVIAFFYTSQLHLNQLMIAGGAWILLILANRLGVRSVFFYTFVGITVIWISFFYSGIHPTIAGILLAFTIPAKTRINKEEYGNRLKGLFQRYLKVETYNRPFNTHKEDRFLKKIRTASDAARTPLQKIENGLHHLVYFIIMPLFAFANAGVVIQEGFWQQMLDPVSMGIILGLIVGKVAGICLMVWLITKSGLGMLPAGSNWRQVITVSAFAGIGFTMSLFIAELAFKNNVLAGNAKSAILLASMIAAALGLLLARFFNRELYKDVPKTEEEKEFIGDNTAD